MTVRKGGERIRSFELFKKETVSRKNTKNRLLYYYGQVLYCRYFTFPIINVIAVNNNPDIIIFKYVLL